MEAVAQAHPAERFPHVKLYNSGNFWDRRAIPPGDMPRIAGALAGRNSVIVETHPKLMDDRAPAFNDALGGGLQVAMGLETADPDALAALNKSMTPDDFAAAARRLTAWGIPVRAFILVRPPGHDEEQGLAWAIRSLEFAQDAGAECCVLIPTRGPDPPSVATITAAFRHGLGRRRGRVFVDLWDLQAPPAERTALDRANRTQAVEMLD